ncbi:MAG: GntR family transcriptional regulator [Proteobacteria bacterium]|nr:GntR family transcriptional regulator [Pseudomonadota bacterium]
MARQILGADTVMHAAPPLEGDVHLPLYRRLYETFARRIAAGDWKPGDGLPAETGLAKIYRIAPGTVRRALDDLALNGLVERRHGLGTFVRRPNFDNAMLRFFRFRDKDGNAFLPESRIVSRKLVSTPPKVARQLGLTDPLVIKMVRHRLWDGVPRLVEDIFLPQDRFKPLLSVSEEMIGPLLYPAYEQLCGQVVFAIEEDISIADVTVDDAADLGLQTGDLTVSVERIARNATATPIEWRISRGEARRFRYQLTSGQGD